jgi:outer membrane protein TolC
MSKNIFVYLLLIAGFLQLLPAFAADTGQRLTEKDVERLVTERNRDIQALKGQINVAEAEVIQAGRVNNLNYVGEVQSFNPTIPNNDNTQYNMGVSYEFLLGNQLQLRRDIASGNINIARLEVELRTRERVFNAKNSYSQLMYDFRLVELKKIHLNHAGEIFTVVDKQYKAGDIAKYDVYRAELDRSYATRLLTNANRQVTTETTSLNALLNQDMNNKIIPTEAFIVKDYKRLSVERLIAYAQTRSPEILTLQSRMATEDLRLRLARAGVMPTLGAELLLGNQGVSARVEIPIPFLYRQEGEIAVSEATTNYLQQQLQARRQQISVDITRAYQELVLAVDAVKTYENTVMEQSKALHVLALKRLKAGEGGILEVLEAEHTRHEHEDEHARLVLDARKAFNNLEYVVGGNTLD